MKKLLFPVLVLFSSCGFHLVLGEPKVGEVTLCDGQGCIGEKTASPSPDRVFDPLSPQIRLSVALARAPFGTRVVSHWTYLDGEREISIRDRVSDLDHPGSVVHAIALPRVGYFKAGHYRVRLEVNGRPGGTRHFQVGERPAPKPRDTAKKPVQDTKKAPSGEKDLLDDDL